MLKDIRSNEKKRGIELEDREEPEDGDEPEDEDDGEPLAMVLSHPNEDNPNKAAVDFVKWRMDTQAEKVAAYSDTYDEVARCFKIVIYTYCNMPIASVCSIRQQHPNYLCGTGHRAREQTSVCGRLLLS